MTLDLRFYWSLLLRRMPAMLLFVLVCSGLAIVSALKLPDTYSTSARLLVEAPEIPERMVASTVQIEAIQQLDIIQQQLMTRANLTDIAHRFSVFEAIAEMEPDEVVTRMREATSIRRSTGRDEATLMIVSFEARTPEIAATVVDEFVSLILAASTASRVRQAGRTLEFFEQEVARLAEDLDRQSAAITAFRSENADALPEDQAYRLNRLSLLQERLGRIEREMSQAEAQRNEIIRTFEVTGQVQGLQTPAQRSAEEEQLIAARGELEYLLSSFAETNPRVVRQQSRIARLEAIVAAQSASELPEGGGTGLSPQEMLFDITMAEIETQLETLRTEETATRAEIDVLEQSITRSSTNGIRLAALQRDYDNIESRYNTAVNNLNQARMSERIEVTAQGQRISVIENAEVPRVPAGPNRSRIAIMGTAVGLALAVGFFVLLEMLNRTVRRPAELTARFDVIPLATIPYMETQRDRLLRRGGLVLAMLVVLTGVPMALWYVDTHHQPLEILVQRVLDRVGLG